MARHRSAVDRARWVSRWRSSGLSCERFARKHGLSESTLYRWSQSASADADASPARFTEVRVVGTASGSMPIVEVEHPSGCVVRVRGAVDEAQLRAVLQVLSAC